jgi:hypothetical protein
MVFANNKTFRATDRLFVRDSALFEESVVYVVRRRNEEQFWHTPRWICWLLAG